jgi:hypothetical protein
MDPAKKLEKELEKKTIELYYEIFNYNLTYNASKRRNLTELKCNFIIDRYPYDINIYEYKGEEGYFIDYLKEKLNKILNSQGFYLKSYELDEIGGKYCVPEDHIGIILTTRDLTEQDNRNKLYNIHYDSLMKCILCNIKKIKNYNKDENYNKDDSSYYNNDFIPKAIVLQVNNELKLYPDVETFYIKEMCKHILTIYDYLEIEKTPPELKELESISSNICTKYIDSFDTTMENVDISSWNGMKQQYYERIGQIFDYYRELPKYIDRYESKLKNSLYGSCSMLNFYYPFQEEVNDNAVQEKILRKFDKKFNEKMREVDGIRTAIDTLTETLRVLKAYLSPNIYIISKKFRHYENIIEVKNEVKNDGKNDGSTILKWTEDKTKQKKIEHGEMSTNISNLLASIKNICLYAKENVSDVSKIKEILFLQKCSIFGFDPNAFIIGKMLNTTHKKDVIEFFRNILSYDEAKYSYKYGAENKHVFILHRKTNPLSTLFYPKNKINKTFMHTIELITYFINGFQTKFLTHKEKLPTDKLKEELIEEILWDYVKVSGSIELLVFKQYLSVDSIQILNNFIELINKIPQS